MSSIVEKMVQRYRIEIETHEVASCVAFACGVDGRAIGVQGPDSRTCIEMLKSVYKSAIDAKPAFAAFMAESWVDYGNDDGIQGTTEALSVLVCWADGRRTHVCTPYVKIDKEVRWRDGEVIRTDILTDEACLLLDWVSAA